MSSTDLESRPVRPPATVAVCGSCQTRDNFNSRFNPGYKRFFSCDLATNQTSVIALMSPPYDVDDFGPPADMSEYDRWNVHSDLSREFLGQLAETRPDYLLVDFFADVYFGVLRLADGRYLTDNRWKLHRTELYSRLREDEGTVALGVLDDAEEYLPLWRDAVARFADHVDRTCPDTKVIVHRGWNTRLVMTPRRPRPVRMGKWKSMYPYDAARANEVWAVLDDHCVQAFGWEEIDLRDLRCPSYAEHPWGPFWVHYTPDYYHRFLAELHKIHLRHHPDDPDVLTRLAAIEEAAAEPALRELAVERAVVARQRERLDRANARITELEASPLRSARRAVARGLGRGGAS